MKLVENKISLEFDRGSLILKASPPEIMKELKKEIPLSYDSRISAYRCDALYYPFLLNRLTEMGFQIDEVINRWRPIEWTKNSLPDLRTEQKEAINNWMNYKRGVVVMPTGTGKTEVALDIMREIGVSTLVVAPIRDLMYQWHRRIFQQLGFDAGIIGDNTYRVNPVSVTTYDSACIHMERLGRMFQFLIFDECHHLPGPMRRDAALMSTAPYRLGLTATPERSDGLEKDLDFLIGPTVYHMPISAAKGKSLANYDTIRIPVYLSSSEQEQYNSFSRCIKEYMYRKNKNTTGYTFKWEDLMAETTKEPEARAIQMAYYKKQSIQDRAEEKLRVLEDLFRLNLGERIIVFTGTNIMAREISQRFLVPCLLNHCDKNERMEILDGFRDYIYPVIVANQVLDEGVDIPAAKIAIVVGGSASTRQAKQRLGRILRKSGNKKGVLYEIVCEDTNEVKRSRQRRSSDAYQGTRHRRF